MEKVSPVTQSMAKIYMENDTSHYMTLTWENINAYLPEEKKGFLSFLKKKKGDIERRQILENG